MLVVPFEEMTEKKKRKKKQTWVGEFLIITYTNV